jgi:hypothetical protein
MWVVVRDEQENKIVHEASTDYVEGTQLPSKFRLVNDEGETCFEGYASVDSDFEPLEEYGDENGCCSIEYWDEALGWVTL